MQNLRFKIIVRGTEQQKLHLVINVTNAAGAVQYCLIVVAGRSGNQLSLQDLKQASADDVKNYLLQIFQADTATTTVSFDLPEEDLVLNLLEGVIVLLGQKLLGVPERQMVGQLEKAQQYMKNSRGSTAWASLVTEKGGKTVSPQKASAPAASRPAGATRPPNPALSRPPMPGKDEPTLDSILGGEESETQHGSISGPQKLQLEKLENVAGAEGKLIRFTSRYSKLLLELSSKVQAAPKGDLKAYAALAREFAPDVAKLAEEVTGVPPEFYVSQSAAKVEKALNQLYIRRLAINLPEIKDKGKGDLGKLLSMEITATRKQEPHSIAVEFLYQKRFGLPPDLGDTLRDLLRFEWGMPVSCETSLPFVTKKVDLTKLYYVHTNAGRTQDTDIFFFRELDGRCGLVYVPYTYLGTGVVNALLNDFFGRPWKAASLGGS